MIKKIYIDAVTYINSIEFQDDFNVIVVSWGPGAALPFYDQAVANTRMVGTQIRLIIDMMVQHAGAKLSDIHLIGHSLGAHTSGYTGYLLHGKLGRITGKYHNRSNTTIEFSIAFYVNLKKRAFIQDLS